MTKRIKYSSETRQKFKKFIETRRKETRFKSPMSYKNIAIEMNQGGFRNRDGLKINTQFIGNMLFRWGE